MTEHMDVRKLNKKENLNLKLTLIVMYLTVIVHGIFLYLGITTHINIISLIGNLVPACLEIYILNSLKKDGIRIRMAVCSDTKE